MPSHKELAPDGSATSHHTPGPWHVTTRQGSRDWAVVAKNERHEICQMFHDGSELNETGEANARLIAAAPELLEACKRAKKLLEPELIKEPDRTIFWELVDAIAIAESQRSQPNSGKAE